jgi:ubiquinone/menaquinone biosynthesis C-methylase UbiE
MLPFGQHDSEEQRRTAKLGCSSGDQMPDFKAIYAHHADSYDQLVSREDYQGNILRALSEIRPLDGLDVVEFGAGTGRFTRLLAPLVGSIRAFDASQHMLDVAAETLARGGWTNWRLAVGDSRALPADDASADLALAGWTFGHMTEWYPDTWRDEIGRTVGEMRRVLRPGGTAVIVETLGTGRETPQPPLQRLASYYMMLERDYGFATTWIRTDYRFESRAEAEELTGFFFGAPSPTIPTEDGRAIVPECTGIWWLTR